MHKPVWIRTCYAADLQVIWESILASGMRDTGSEEERSLVLDKEDLYDDYGEDWTKVFLRLPLLLDTRGYDDDPSQDMAPDNCEGHDDEAYEALHKAARLEEQAVYLVDKQALRDNLVKLIYLDIYGNVVWHNMIAPEHIWWYEAYYSAGGMLHWMEELCADDESLLTPGAQLQGEEM
jgi:hypothetical protein